MKEKEKAFIGINLLLDLIDKPVKDLSMLAKDLFKFSIFNISDLEIGNVVATSKYMDHLTLAPNRINELSSIKSIALALVKDSKRCKELKEQLEKLSKYRSEVILNRIAEIYLNYISDLPVRFQIKNKELSSLDIVNIRVILLLSIRLMIYYLQIGGKLTNYSN